MGSAALSTGGVQLQPLGQTRFIFCRPQRTSVVPRISCPLVVRCSASKERKTLERKDLATGRLSPTQEKGEAEEGWRVLDPKAYDKPWDIPWGGGAVAGGMALWLLSFGLTAFVLMPFAYTRIVGVALWGLGPQGQADFALWTELVQVLETFAVIYLVTRKESDTWGERKLFNFNPAAPFEKGSGWLAWALIGLALAPLVVGATVSLVSLVGYEQAVGEGRGTVDGVAGMISMDGGTYLRLLAVTGVFAPLLEETLFRGFLLTSFTKVMPTWLAVLSSSLAFGVAHLSLKDLPILVSLGVLLGFTYIRSKNLLTPILVHGTWNSVVLSLLFWLTANGIDIQQLLHETASTAN